MPQLHEMKKLMIPLVQLLKTRGVFFVNCAVEPNSIQVGIAMFEVTGRVSVVDEAGNRYLIDIPDGAESPLYKTTFKRHD